MFNRKKCKQCAYRIKLTGGVENVQNAHGIACGYALLTGVTCTTYRGEDKRGEDKNNCLLFKKGGADGRETN